MCFNEWAEGRAIFATIPTMTYSDSLSTWPPEPIHPSHRASCVTPLLQSHWLSREILFFSDAADKGEFYIFYSIERVFVFSLTSSPFRQSDGGLPGDSDRGGDISAYCRLCVP